jgi:SSS family transporter
MRFHPKIRMLASAIAIVLQLGGRMSIVLFLPSLAMSAVTGINVVYSVLIMGLVTIAYTTMGGMKAVIWTDFIQVFVMLGGAFIAIGFVISHVDGGIADFIKIAAADDKFHTFDWSFDLTKATIWGFLLVAILQSLTYPQDQVMMQRVLSTKSDKEAGWSVWTLAAIVVPGNLTFFAIGTALYVFYKQHPASLNPTLNIDSTFPQFIAAELPAGLTGLIIAGIFAASMSTLSSCINSVATLVSVDFYERNWKNATPAKSVKLAEKVTIIAGLIGIGTALLLALADIKSALDTSFVLIGLLGGGFAGCYALGMFTRRANWQGAFIGVGASLVITFTAWIFDAVHPFFYIVIAILSCIVAGYAASYMFPPPQQSLHGLTIFSPRREPLVITPP